MADEVVGTDTGAAAAEATSSPAIEGAASSGVTAEDVAGIAASLSQESGQPAPTSGGGQHGVAPRRGGHIPLDRHTQILKNTRQAAAEEAAAKVRSTYGLTGNHSPEVVKQALAVAQWLDQDPVTVANEILKRMGRTGETPRQAADAVVDKIEASLRSEDGKSVYTAEQVEQLVESRLKKALDAFDQRVTQAYGPLREKAEAQERKAHIDQRVSQVLAHYRQQPHFRELEPEMKPLIQKGFSLVEAYNHLILTKILPQATQVTQQQTDAHQQLARKANAKGIGPARDPVSGQFMKPTEMDTLDVVRQTWKELGGGRP